MKEPWVKHPLALAGWEWGFLVAVLALCWGYSLWSFVRCDYASVEEFLARAPQLEAALKRQAALEGGFPPDTMGCNPPQGWDPKEAPWRRNWRIDYEVHPNGMGGYFVALEFLGCLRQPQYMGLGMDPGYRRLHGRGQKVPGTSNRLWLVAESAPLREPTPAMEGKEPGRPSKK